MSERVFPLPGQAESRTLPGSRTAAVCSAVTRRFEMDMQGVLMAMAGGCHQHPRSAPFSHWFVAYHASSPDVIGMMDARIGACLPCAAGAQRAVRRRTEQRGGVGLDLTEPGRPVLRIDDDRHAVMQRRHLGVGPRGDDRKRALDLAPSPRQLSQIPPRSSGIRLGAVPVRTRPGPRSRAAPARPRRRTAPPPRHRPRSRPRCAPACRA